MEPNEKTWPTYTEAKMMMASRDIGSRKAYMEWHKSRRVQFVPRMPDRVYDRTGDWGGWNDYLTNTNTFRTWDRTEYLPFYEAARWVHTLNLGSINEWKDYISDNELPENIPKYPASAYKDVWYKGVGFTEWLGLDLRSKMEVVVEGELTKCWGLVHVHGMPPNVFTVLKDIESTLRLDHGVKYDIIVMYQYESELEDQLWRVLSSMTTVYGEDQHRMCANYYMVQEQLDRILLRV